MFDFGCLRMLTSAFLFSVHSPRAPTHVYVLSTSRYVPRTSSRMSTQQQQLCTYVILSSFFTLSRWGRSTSGTTLKSTEAALFARSRGRILHEVRMYVGTYCYDRYGRRTFVERFFDSVQCLHCVCAFVCAHTSIVLRPSLFQAASAPRCRSHLLELPLAAPLLITLCSQLSQIGRTRRT